MKPLSAWRGEIAGIDSDPRLSVEPGKRGQPTAIWDGISVHSRYDPHAEAERWAGELDLDTARPVILIGLGLGYHATALHSSGCDVTVVECFPAMLRAAVEAEIAPDATPVVLAGDATTAAAELRSIAMRRPQVVATPFIQRAAPEFADELRKAITDEALRGQRLNVVVVGPMYGGSLPIAESLARAFKSIGHNTRYVDNSAAWPLYKAMAGSVRSKRVMNQLGGVLANALNEWSYAQTMEFHPDIVVALAQAPLNATFCQRVRKEGVVTAYWFVENWRHMPYWQEICRDYDTFMHIQPGAFEAQLAEAGCLDAIHMPTACDPEKHRPVELGDDDDAYRCEVSFAGAGYPNRINVLRAITDFDLKIWGVEWGANELAKHVQAPGQRFDADVFSKICAGSKICLNLHSSTTHPDIDLECDAVNPRVFDIAACGGFQLCDAIPGVANLFDRDAEVPAYSTIPDLRERITLYLANEDERMQIAKRAHERVIAEHTYAHRAQAMIDRIVDRHGNEILRKGICVQRTVGEIADREESGGALQTYLKGLPADLPFNQASINEAMAQAPNPPATEPEQIFSFLHTMREFSESILDERES